MDAPMVSLEKISSMIVWVDEVMCSDKDRQK